MVLVLLPKLANGFASFPPITLAENEMGVLVGKFSLLSVGAMDVKGFGCPNVKPAEDDAVDIPNC